MKGRQVAVRYARALFELALERKELEAVHKDVLLLQQVCRDSKDFRLLLKSPIVQTDKKEKIFHHLFAKEIGALTLGFLLLLVRKGRESFIAVIADEFIERIREIMIEYTNATVELAESVDPETVGGFVLSWKDKQYDATISHQIELLKRGVARVNLYVKEI
jgi:F-type H+-transporting ATPase subunit delta